MEKQVTLQCSAVAKCFTQTAMILLALMCAITRLYDNKHHVTDIMAGMALGVLVGYYIVRFIQTEMFKCILFFCLLISFFFINKYIFYLLFFFFFFNLR